MEVSIRFKVALYAAKDQWRTPAHDLKQRSEDRSQRADVRVRKRRTPNTEHRTPNCHDLTIQCFNLAKRSVARGEWTGGQSSRLRLATARQEEVRGEEKMTKPRKGAFRPV